MRSSSRTLSPPPATKPRKRPVQAGLRGYPQVWRTLWIRRPPRAITAPPPAPYSPSAASLGASHPRKMWINHGVAHRLPTPPRPRMSVRREGPRMRRALLGQGPYGIVCLFCAGGVLSETHLPTKEAAAPSGARVSGPHAHTRRTPHAPASSGQGEASADRFRLGPGCRPRFRSVGSRGKTSSAAYIVKAPAAPLLSWFCMRALTGWAPYASASWWDAGSDAQSGEID